MGYLPDWLYGSFIGFIAAPWVWLHFSRNLQRDGDYGDQEGLSERLQRYKFLTIMIGIAVLFFTIEPLLLSLMARANKAELWGASITLTERRSTTQSPVIQTGPAGPANQSLGLLTVSTESAAYR
jgi:hypothetical protein